MPQTPPIVAYGGQAVIEGVMFAGRTVNVTAVRRKDQSIGFFETPRKEQPWVAPLKRIPFVRGIVALIDSVAKGSVHLNYATESYALEAEEKNEAPAKATIGQKVTLVVGVAIVGVLSFLFGKVLFTVLPAAVEEWLFRDLFDNIFLHNVLEGVIKIVFLVGYISLIARLPMIKRLFQYHGAEHKVISAYEGGDPLTVAHVQKYSTLHYRCGSSFIVLTVLVGVLLYSFFEWSSMSERIVIRLLLLPVVIGISYEILRFTNSVRRVPLLRYLGYPGLWLQKLTTKQPTDDQVEVAIASFERMLQLDQRSSTPAS